MQSLDRPNDKSKRGARTHSLSLFCKIYHLFFHLSSPNIRLAYSSPSEIHRVPTQLLSFPMLPFRARLYWATDPKPALRSFAEDFLAANAGESRPDWVLMSPPYKGALAFVQVALALTKEGAAIKLPLSFLEPCTDRAVWLRNNPPAQCVFLRRAPYIIGSNVKACEFWGVWYTDSGRSGNSNGAKILFCSG